MTGEREARDEGRARRALLRYARHELRTPISAIIGYSEMLLEDTADRGEEAKGLRSDLEKIHTAGSRLLALVNDPQMELDLETAGASFRRAIRTTINAVIGYSEVLLEKAEERGTRDLMPDLLRIRSAAKQLFASIEEFVRLGKIETGLAEADLQSPSASPMIQEAVAAMPSPTEESEAPKVAPGSLLVVDDNETSRDLLSRQLERQGHAVSVAENGRRALETLRDRRFDLVLLDIMMPELNGFEVLQQLKADNNLRDLPVIVISALNDMESVIRCIEMDAIDYLPKPFAPVLLRARVNASLAQKRLHDMEKAYVMQIQRVSARFRAIFDGAAIGIGLLDGLGRYAESNPALQRMLGYGQEALRGTVFILYTHPEDATADATMFQELMAGERGDYQIEKRYLCRDGRLMWGRQTVSLVRDTEGSPRFAIAMVEDVTVRKRAEEELKHLSVHDPLTDLCNRAYFEQEMLRLGHSRQYPITAVMLDVDDLKAVNDNQGHAAGDQLLQRTAEVLEVAFRDEDVIARIGGDEFAVLLPKTDAAAAERIVLRVRDCLLADNALHEGAPLSLSLGAATAEGPELPLAEILKRADGRMYDEKLSHPGHRR